MPEDKIYVKVYAGDLIYDRLSITTDNVEHFNAENIKKTDSKRVNFYRLRLSGVTLHCLIRALQECQQCRNVVINYILNRRHITRLRVHLLPLSSCPETIDYNWNEKCYHLVRERCELDHTLSWLSTLGGAFSALGDYFADCAETAGKISVHQFQLALRLGDPGIAARCRLYFALSMIQQKHFRLAKSVILHEYALANSMTVVDHRLAKMCYGIWSKLKYEWSLYKKKRKKI